MVIYATLVNFFNGIFDEYVYKYCHLDLLLVHPLSYLLGTDADVRLRACSCSPTLL